MTLPRTFPSLNPPSPVLGEGGYYLSPQWEHDRGMRDAMAHDASLAGSTLRSYLDRRGERTSEAQAIREGALVALSRLAGAHRDERLSEVAQGDEDRLAWRDQGGHDAPSWDGRACVSYTDDPDLGPALDSAGPITGQGRLLLSHKAAVVGRMAGSKGKAAPGKRKGVKGRLAALQAKRARESRLLLATSSSGAGSTRPS